MSSKQDSVAIPMKRKDFIKLQNEWYAKAAKSGFTDIEWYDPKTGLGQNADYMKRNSFQLAYNYKETTAQHYRICQNFLTNASLFRKKDRKIFQLYTDGLTFREILKHLRDLGGGYAYGWKGKKSISLYSLHKIIKRYIRYAYAWNRVSAEGLMNEDVTYQAEAADAD